MARRGELWFVLIVLLIVGIGFVAWAQGNSLRMTKVSPTGHREAVVLASNRDRLHSRAWLYIRDPHGPARMERVAGLLNNSLDYIAGIAWSPDESRLVVANNYDGPPIVVIVDLGDRSGRISDPSPIRGRTAADIHQVVQTKYAVRTITRADLTCPSPCPRVPVRLRTESEVRGVLS